MIVTNSSASQRAAILPSPAANRAETALPSRWTSFLSYFAFASALFGSKLWLICCCGNATPFWDQWDSEAALLFKPFLEGTLRLAGLFAAHNEHRIFTTRLLVLALLKLNGTWNPLLEMAVNAALQVVVLAIIVGMLARVAGRAYLPGLLLFAAVLFAVPCAWENTLSGFQMQFPLVLFFSLACLWLAVTRDPLSPGWWAGTACGVLAYLSFASGSCAPGVAALLGLAFYATGVRRTRKQLLAVAILGGLSAAGVALTPAMPHHAALKAASATQFLHAWTTVLGWPVSQRLYGTILAYLPALAFAAAVLRQRPPAKSPKWFLLAAVVWMAAQTGMIAYGRAQGALSPRYLDIFSIGILVNLTCAISLANDYGGKRLAWTMPGAALWAAAILVFLGIYAGRHLPGDLAEKRADGLAEEVNTKAFLATGDIAHLKDKPLLHIPYPNPDRLASLLSEPTIRSILPANLAANAKTGRLDGAVTRLLHAYHVFLMLGFAALVVLSLRPGTAFRSVAEETSAPSIDAGAAALDRSQRLQRKAG